MTPLQTINRLMDDNRERTTRDVAYQTGLHVDEVRTLLQELKRRRLVSTSRKSMTDIWRKTA